MTGASTGSTSGLSRSESLRVAPSRSESLRDALSRSDPRRAQQWRDLRGRRVGRQHPWWASRAPVTETRRFESLQGRVLRGRRVVLQGTQAAPVVGVTCPRHRTPQSRARVTLQPRTHFTIQSRARVTVQSRASITKQSRHDTVTVQYGTGPRPQTGRKGPKEMLGRVLCIEPWARDCTVTRARPDPLRLALVRRRDHIAQTGLCQGLWPQTGP